MTEIIKIGNIEASIIIKKRKTVGLFYTIENGVYVGIDNTTGDAWTEDFKTLAACKKWLREGRK